MVENFIPFAVSPSSFLIDFLQFFSALFLKAVVSYKITIFFKKFLY